MKAEMQFLSINKPMGLKEAGRFAVNISMNGYHMAVTELQEKLDKGIWPWELSSSHPTRAQGQGKEGNRSPRGLVNSQMGLWDMDVKPSAQRVSAGPVLLKLNKIKINIQICKCLTLREKIGKNGYWKWWNKNFPIKIFLPDILIVTEHFSSRKASLILFF